MEDNKRHWEAERTTQSREYRLWRETEVRRLVRRRKWAARLGPILFGGGLLAVGRIAWLMVTDNGGGLAGLALYGLLAWIGAGMWLARNGPLLLPPTEQEIAERVAGIGSAEPRLSADKDRA